ncbi:MAG: hypothetical protein ABIL01_23390 [Pseudomonadota bacterium]
MLTLSVPCARQLAEEGSARQAAWRLCETDFYISEFLTHNGKMPDVHQILQTVVVKCRFTDVVFSAARAELSELLQAK